MNRATGAALSYLLTRGRRVVYRQPHTGRFFRVLYDMSLRGQVITHDQSTKTGVIRIEDSAHAVVFMEGDITNKSPDAGSLIGRTLEFDVVQTANGLIAVNIRLTRGRMFRPGEWFWLVASPALVAGGTYALMLAVGYPLLYAYIISVNFVTFLLCVAFARRAWTYGTRPSDLALFLLALGGGAMSGLVASYLVPTKFRSDAGRFALFGLMVVQLILLHRYQPLFFTETSLQILLLKR
jgi:uncharacterized membrane protein YsdA (DUF1294 family)